MPKLKGTSCCPCPRCICIKLHFGPHDRHENNNWYLSAVCHILSTTDNSYWLIIWQSKRVVTKAIFVSKSRCTQKMKAKQKLPLRQEMVQSNCVYVVQSQIIHLYSPCVNTFAKSQYVNDTRRHHWKYEVTQLFSAFCMRGICKYSQCDSVT